MELGIVFERYGMSTISLVLALAVVLVTVIHHFLKSRGLPPGPLGVPYFGYWIFMKEANCGKKLHSCTKKYGDIFSFTSFGRLYISLGSVKAIREAHVTNSDCFADRLEDFSLLSYVFADGVGFANGEPWKVLRKFFLRTLKERGIISIKDSMSGPMYESIKATTDDFKAKIGEPINIINLVTDKCTTILRASLFGETGLSDAIVRELNDDYAAVMASMTATNLLIAGNFAKHLVLPPYPLKSCFSEPNIKFKRMEALLYKIIDEHKSTYDEDNMRDVIDEYIQERNDKRSKGDPMAHHLTDKALMSSLVQLVGDGVLSVASFICLFLKIVLDHPEEQDKIYQEIAEVVGLDRQPMIEDKSKLVYTNAFITEGLRTTDIFPFFPSLECTKETTLSGYRIPKGSITLMNTWSAHLDPKVYDDPEKFNPLRFLPKDAKQRPELPITFGVGKRACIGEGFAMMQVFLFLVTIIQNFQLSLPEGIKTSSFDDLLSGKLQIFAHPRSHK